MSTSSKHDLRAVSRLFAISGDFRESAPYGSGHINDTYAVVYSQAGAPVRYIFQRLNDHVFKNPVALMENVGRVTDHARKRLEADGVEDATRRTLITVRSVDGKSYAHDADGNLWRVYLFIEGATGHDIIERPEQAYEAACAFGEFQRLLADLGGERLHETIPGFHHTRQRYETLLAAIEADTHNRAAEVKDLIDFATAHEGEVGRLIDAMAKGEIPERVTHNDTKLNNVLIDDATGKASCVIDLDTTMPGCALYDFGDMVRSATNSAAEDEADPAKIRSRPEIFEALVRGYLKSAGGFLTSAERGELAFAGRLLTLECGLRFLTDYLQGDVYFKIKRPTHNRDRTHNQFALVRSLEEQSEAHQALIDSID